MMAILTQMYEDPEISDKEWFIITDDDTLLRFVLKVVGSNPSNDQENCFVLLQNSNLN